MIVSVHIPKTAGVSFGGRLEGAFGSRLLYDYDDWVGLNTAQANLRRVERVLEARGRREQLIRDYDIIHGHFVADKYAELFPSTHFVAFFREPCQQLASLYHFFLRNGGKSNIHPAAKVFHRVRPTLPEFIAEARNVQSMFIGRVPINDFAVVGVIEKYDDGIALFEDVFRCKLAPERDRFNVNQSQQGGRYDIDNETWRAVERYCQADIQLYQTAREMFRRLSTRYQR
jgi:hypothetical protein